MNENDRFEKAARSKSRAYLLAYYLSALTACLSVTVACWSAFPDAYAAQLSFLVSTLTVANSALCIGLYFRFKQRAEDRQQDTRIATLEARLNRLEAAAGQV